MGKEKVLVVSSCGTASPTNGYGGLEQIAADSARGLALKKWDVTVAVSLDSSKKFYPKNVKVIPTVMSRITGGIPEQEHWDVLNKRLERDGGIGKFDFVIDDTHRGWTKLVQGEKTGWYWRLHNDPSGFEGSPPPQTYPGIVGPSYDCAHAYCERFRGTAIKKKIGDQETQQFLGAVAMTNHHGINHKEFAYDAKGGDRYLFLGRIQGIKGVELAVNVFKDLGLPLDVVGADDHFGPADSNLYVKRVKGQCDGKLINYIGKVSHEEKVKLLQKAKALVSPSSFREPLGLMSLEAQSCGTPSIVSAAGGLPETVRHGKTGFVFHAISELRDALLAIEEGQLKFRRADCRAWVESHWTVEKMAERWERIFNSEPF